MDIFEQPCGCLLHDTRHRDSGPGDKHRECRREGACISASHVQLSGWWCQENWEIPGQDRMPAERSIENNRKQ